MSGKGSKRRPIDKEAKKTFDKNWDKIFKKSKPNKKENSTWKPS